ncbi:mycothiol synthase [Friedmanniella luteola]|uniref:Mycothiol acetyltransferase n=1 Tax=Friedmanniella luteola TaxID=546871 RepID=A0A1H1LV85_9ACTN|nr:mycothiol synthase [Friedmanniella luteola]SDR78192.1 mycothiol synthase [Friedmanniella luteola]
MARSVRTTTLERLDPAHADAVRRLVADAAVVDGASALNEAALLALEHPGDVRHVLALPADGADVADGAPLRGYAQLERGLGSSTGQLVVHPGQRRQGVGTSLLRQLVAQAPSRLQVWAVGDRPAAQVLARHVGLVPARELLVMTRPLDAGLRAPRVPDGVEIRTFEPGRDEQAWLGVNARAFASHPEQGAITADDLALRMAEPWFDAGGFFLAERAGVLVGFHWTKQHPGTLGEVYVLGVDPGAGGQGLGGALLDTGLQHLRAVGDTEVELYVEGDHAGAVGLYTGRGFSTASRDVMYAQP